MDASSSQSMEDDSASKSNLCIKIKIPNTKDKIAAVQAGGGGGGDGGSGSLQGQAGPIICEYCGKQFSSGKAWGGHKRHHLQMKKKNSKVQEASKLKKEIKEHSSKNRCATIYAGDVTMKDGIPTCRLCGKNFPSMNSLFGHMRFHIERYREGSQSPLSQEAEDGIQEKGKSERRSINLSIELVGWLKKDQRGRKRFPDMIIPEAAHNLITLSRHRANQCTPPSKKSMAEADRSNPSSPFDSSSPLENRDEPKRKKMKLNYVSKNIVTESENLIESAMPEEATGGLVTMETETSFHCEICNKKFATGQALGGHKRCHWKATPAKPVSMEVIASTGESNVASASSGEASSQAANGRLSIDLNKPYIVQDGEQD